MPGHFVRFFFKTVRDGTNGHFPGSFKTRSVRSLVRRWEWKGKTLSTREVIRLFVLIVGISCLVVMWAMRLVRLGTVLRERSSETRKIARVCTQGSGGGVGSCKSLRISALKERWPFLRTKRRVRRACSIRNAS